MTAAHAAARITLNPQLTEATAQGINQQQAANQWLTELRQ
jgi:hypothetical protein